jgi:hypothetical protein
MLADTASALILVSSIHQLSNPNRAIEKRVFGVNVKVNEGIAGHRTSVFSEENFSQIYPAFHRNFSCGSRNAEVERPLRRAMLKKCGFAA